MMHARLMFFMLLLQLYEIKLILFIPNKKRETFKFQTYQIHESSDISECDATREDKPEKTCLKVVEMEIADFAETDDAQLSEDRSWDDDKQGVCDVE